MIITRIDATAAPRPIMSRCVMYGQMVYLSGLTAPDSSQDIKGQAQQILELVDDYLDRANTDKSHALTAQIWLKHMSDFAAFNSVWNAWVDPIQAPARACVEATMARPEVLVEIMITAARAAA